MFLVDGNQEHLKWDHFTGDESIIANNPDYSKNRNILIVLLGTD